MMSEDDYSIDELARMHAEEIHMYEAAAGYHDPIEIDRLKEVAADQAMMEDIAAEQTGEASWGQALENRGWKEAVRDEQRNADDIIF